MAIWLIRAGSHGEYEQKFIQEKPRLCNVGRTQRRPGKITRPRCPDSRDDRELAPPPVEKIREMEKRLEELDPYQFQGFDGFYDGAPVASSWDTSCNAAFRFTRSGRRIGNIS